jgi:hypothetical protein
VGSLFSKIEFVIVAYEYINYFKCFLLKKVYLIIGGNKMKKKILVCLFLVLIIGIVTAVAVSAQNPGGAQHINGTKTINVDTKTTAECKNAVDSCAAKAMEYKTILQLQGYKAAVVLDATLDYHCNCMVNEGCKNYAVDNIPVCENRV